MQQKKFFGHPHQLSMLFHIELWERFSFYGMKTILFLYLWYAVSHGGLGIDKNLAGGIVGAYAGSVYLSTIIGGWLSDRVLGAERMLFWSGVVVMLGHIALACFPGIAGLMIGLVLISLGSGGVKTSASAMVGSLYEDEDKKHLRDAGFSIFYIAINIGAVLGPLLSGWLQTIKGFHYGFGVAALGMAFGLWQYAMGRKQLPLTAVANPLTAQARTRAILISLGIVALLTIALVLGWLNLNNFSTILLLIVMIMTVIYFVYLLQCRAVTHRSYILAYIPLFITISIFWALWAQLDTAVVVYFDESVNRTIGGFTIPVAWQGSIQSFWVILFSGVMATLWAKMGVKQPKTPMKFVWAMMCIGITYLLFIPFFESGHAMPVVILALLILLATVAELMLSPISLSFITKIAPKEFKSQMLSLNFLSFSLGFTLSGKLFETQFDAHNPVQFYILIGGIGIITGIVLLFMVPLLNKLLKGAD